MIPFVLLVVGHGAGKNDSAQYTTTWRGRHPFSYLFIDKYIYVYFFHHIFNNHNNNSVRFFLKIMVSNLCVCVRAIVSLSS
jgi:hypothetical protein